MFIPLLALSWLGSVISIMSGSVLWAFGGRIVRRAVVVAGLLVARAIECFEAHYCFRLTGVLSIK